MLSSLRSARRARALLARRAKLDGSHSTACRFAPLGCGNTLVGSLRFSSFAFSLHSWLLRALFHHADVREVAIALCPVEAVTDDKLVCDRKPQVVDGRLHTRARRFVQQRAQL